MNNQKKWDDQVLSERERQKIRSDVYGADSDEAPNLNDEKIAFFAKYATGRKVLDIGCVDHSENNRRSKYWLHKALRTVSSALIGLDYYKKGVEELNNAGYCVLHGDAQSFRFEEKVEVITAGDLVEHLPDLKGFFESCHAATTSKGVLVVSTPNPWCWKYLTYHIFFGKLTPVNREHICWFCLQTLENLASRFGFQILEYKFCSRRWYEKLMPLPPRLKHTTLCVAFTHIPRDSGDC